MQIVVVNNHSRAFSFERGSASPPQTYPSSVMPRLTVLSRRNSSSSGCTRSEFPQSFGRSSCGPSTRGTPSQTRSWWMCTPRVASMTSRFGKPSHRSKFTRWTGALSHCPLRRPDQRVAHPQKERLGLGHKEPNVVQSRNEKLNDDPQEKTAQGLPRSVGCQNRLCVWPGKTRHKTLKGYVNNKQHRQELTMAFSSVATVLPLGMVFGKPHGDPAPDIIRSRKLTEHVGLHFSNNHAFPFYFKRTISCMKTDSEGFWSL